MKRKGQGGLRCDVAVWSVKPCWGEVQTVDLAVAGIPGSLGRGPGSLRLCEFHSRLELMEWGVAAFLNKYPMAAGGSPDETGASAWREEEAGQDEAGGDADPHLRLMAPDVLESLVNAGVGDSPPGGYYPRPEFEHLKSVRVDLNEARLTDKQLTALCLVFYGGLKKKRAAEVMRISSQALTDHLKAALKKIEETIR